MMKNHAKTAKPPPSKIFFFVCSLVSVLYLDISMYTKIMCPQFIMVSNHQSPPSNLYDSTFTLYFSAASISCKGFLKLSVTFITTPSISGVVTVEVVLDELEPDEVSTEAGEAEELGRLQMSCPKAISTDTARKISRQPFMKLVIGIVDQFLNRIQQILYHLQRGRKILRMWSTSGRTTRFLPLTLIWLCTLNSLFCLSLLISRTILNCQSGSKPGYFNFFLTFSSRGYRYSKFLGFISILLLYPIPSYLRYCFILKSIKSSFRFFKGAEVLLFRCGVSGYYIQALKNSVPRILPTKRLISGIWLKYFVLISKLDLRSSLEPGRGGSYLKLKMGSDKLDKKIISISGEIFEFYSSYSLEILCLERAL